MDIRKITDRYFVSPQIDPGDMKEILAQGITTIIDNRPDAEIPPSHHAQSMRAAAEMAGLTFVELPITHQTMTAENVAIQAQAIADASGGVLAYCASGTRSTVIWALSMARDGAMPVDDIVNAAAQGGYDLSGMRPTLEGLFPA
jgi:uncharacterized protein (TIGR01244 family)